jgi:hypothetical protein
MECGAVTDEETFAFTRFVNDVLYTGLFVFERVVPPDNVIEWLRPLASDEASRALLMHEEPLYIAADLLGIDRFAASFVPFAGKYQEFRARFLYPSRATGLGLAHKP